MSSLKADFDELRERIRHGRKLGHASFEPIYYLVFPPEQILEVKRQTPAWVAKLHQEGWYVHTFSIAEHVWTLLIQAGRRTQEADTSRSRCHARRCACATAKKLAEIPETRGRKGRTSHHGHRFSPPPGTRRMRVNPAYVAGSGSENAQPRTVGR